MNDIKKLDPTYKEPQAVKLQPEWKNEPNVELLKRDLTKSKSSHDVQVGRVKTWNHMRDLTGPYARKKKRGRSSFQPRTVRRQAEWRYSAISEPFLSSDKMFEIRPRTAEDVDAAEQNQLLLNYQWDHIIDKVAFIDDYSRIVTDEGTAIIKLGWDRQTEMRKRQVPVYDFIAINPLEENKMQMIQQALELKNTNPRGYEEEVGDVLKQAVEFYEETEQFTTPRQTGFTEEEYEHVLVNEPTVELIYLDNLYVDPSSNNDYKKARFMIHSYETSRAELKKDKRFKNLDVVDFDGSDVLNAPDHATSTPSDFNFNDKLRKRVVAYEYWGDYDIHGTGELVPIVATWIDNVMIRMEENPFPDKRPPFVMVKYLPVKREMYGETDAALTGENQDVIGAIYRGMIDLMGRSANSQQGFAKGMLDVTNKRRFEAGMDYEFNPTASPADGMYQHKYPEIPQSAFSMIQLQNQEAEAISGVKSFSGGVSGEAYGDVAAGIRGVLDASSKREMNILRRLTRGIQDVGRKMLMMNSVFLSEKEIVRVTNEKYVEIRREDLAGNFDLVVDISTPEIDEQRAQDLGFMLQTMGPEMPIDLQTMLLSDIAKLKNMPELAKRLETYQPQPDPVAEKLKELQVAELEYKIEEIKSKTELNRARAAEAYADAEATEVETELEISGETHQKTLEQQGAQAKANGDLEITKSLLAPSKEGEQKGDILAAAGFQKLVKQENNAARNAANATNIGSQFHDPDQDPALNPGIIL